MNLFMLLQRSKEHLEKGSSEFSDTADTILALLRSHEVIPYKRSTVNGELHKMVAGAIVEAYDRDTTIDVSSRHQGLYSHYGFSTKIVEYLDKAVERELLISEFNKAKGKLRIGSLLQEYLDYYPVVEANT
jgi:hypothetical protein